MPRKAPFLTILFFLLLSPFSLSWPSHFTSSNLSQAETQINTQEPWVISENTTWTKQNSPYIITTLIQIEPQATLTIEPGTIIKLYSSDPNQQLAGFLVSGSLIASGTPQEPIVFTSLYDQDYASSTISNQNHPPAPTDWTGILTAPNSTLILNHTIVKYAGSITDKPQLVKANQVQAQATSPFPDPDKNYTGALNIGPQTTTAITNSQISDNLIGLFFQTSANNIISFSVHHNDILNNSLAGAYNPNTNTAPFDLTNNFWGHPTGPYHQQTNPPGQGNQVLGPITFTPFLSQSALTPPPSPPQPTTPDPVILIPGIMGSWRVGSKWQLDPILHTYDNLWQALKQAGYQENKTLFAFPYQWRLSNQYTALLLKDKIQEIKNICHCPKVDIIAHSMGGLVARAYIESNDYQNDVDQLIFLATPHQGAPKAYLTWEGGEVGPKIKNQIQQRIFKVEADFNGYKDLFSYIHNLPMTSVQELLPTFDYLRDKGASTLRPYPENYPQNTFLEFLNQPSQLAKLNQVRITNIIANTGPNSTINVIRVVKKEFIDGRWEHGYPEHYSFPFTDHGLEYGSGDITVPLCSNQNFLGLNDVVINSTHDDIVTDAQKEIIKELTGQEPADEVKINIFKKWLLVRIFSPADFLIISPDGKKLGHDFAQATTTNEINNAFYTGFETEPEFAVIPNPIPGQYQVILHSIGQGGRYTLSLSYIDDNQAIDKSYTATITPQIEQTLIFTYTASSTDQDNIISNLIPKPEKITIDGLIKKIKAYYNQGQIKKKYIVYCLTSRLKMLKLRLKLFNRQKQFLIKIKAKTQANQKIKPKTKQRIIKRIDKRLKYLDKQRTKFINKIIIRLQHQLTHFYHQNLVQPQAYQALTNNFNYLKENL